MALVKRNCHIHWARPISALIDPVAGSRNAIAESLSNLVLGTIERGFRFSFFICKLDGFVK
jgi:hypothetical protein